MPKAFLKSRYFTSQTHVSNYISYIHKQSPIFGLEGDVPLESALFEASLHRQSQKWCHIYSMSADDCQRLSIDRSYLQNLISAHRDTIARAYNITPANLQVVASFHNKDHHPHIHLIVYSTHPREGHIHVHTCQDKNKQLADASRALKSIFANEIFKDDLEELKITKSDQRTELNKQINEIVQTKAGYHIAPEIATGLQELARELESVKGKKVYGYLPPPIKEKVDTLLRCILEKDQMAAQLFLQFSDSQHQLIETYVDSKTTLATKMEEWETAFFHPSKGDDTRRHNLIIKAALASPQQTVQKKNIAEEPAEEKVCAIEPSAPPKLTLPAEAKEVTAKQIFTITNKVENQYQHKDAQQNAKNLVWKMCLNLAKSTQYNHAKHNLSHSPPLRNKRLRKVTHRQNREQNIYERE